MTPILTAARPLIVEGAKAGLQALVAVGVLYGGAAVIGGAGYGAYKGGQKAKNRFTAWRANRAERKALAAQAKAEGTDNVVPMTPQPAA